MSYSRGDNGGGRERGGAWLPVRVDTSPRHNDDAAAPQRASAAAGVRRDVLTPSPDGHGQYGRATGASPDLGASAGSGDSGGDQGWGTASGGAGSSVTWGKVRRASMISAVSSFTRGSGRVSPDGLSPSNRHRTASMASGASGAGAGKRRRGSMASVVSSTGFTRGSGGRVSPDPVSPGNRNRSPGSGAFSPRSFSSKRSGDEDGNTSPRSLLALPASAAPSQGLRGSGKSKHLRALSEYDAQGLAGAGGSSAGSGDGGSRGSRHQLRRAGSTRDADGAHRHGPSASDRPLSRTYTAPLRGAAAMRRAAHLGGAGAAASPARNSPHGSVGSGGGSRRRAHRRHRSKLNLVNTEQEEHHVKVGVRIRPLIPLERTKDPRMAWRVVGEQNNMVAEAQAMDDGSAKAYKYDNVFTEHDGTQAVYDKLARPIIMGAFEGYNCTLFAYGQTASGKTYTLLGDPSEPGIIVRGIHDVFDSIHNHTGWEHCVRVSYIEIYNGNITDLLSGEEHLKVIEDPIAGPTVHNVCEQVVMTPQSTFELIDVGERRRHTGSTDMNLRSSRSHTMFRLVIESRQLSDEEASARPDDTGKLTSTPRSGAGHSIGSGSGPKKKGQVHVSYVNLVDLAGSERVSKTKATGLRVKEGGNINQSLLALTNVIQALLHDQQHIPYRNSVLTRLLTTSLGGNAKTGMVACISPARWNREESLSTLRFAARAMRVVNRAQVNTIEHSDALIVRYKDEIKDLKKRLATGEGAVMRTSDGRVLSAADIKAEMTEIEAQLHQQELETNNARVELENIKDLVQVANVAAKADARLGVHAHTALLAVSQGRRRALSVIEEVMRRGEATGSGGPLRAARRRLLAKAKARNNSIRHTMGELDLDLGSHGDGSSEEEEDDDDTEEPPWVMGELMESMVAERNTTVAGLSAKLHKVESETIILDARVTQLQSEARRKDDRLGDAQATIADLRERLHNATARADSNADIAENHRRTAESLQASLDKANAGRAKAQEAAAAARDAADEAAARASRRASELEVQVEEAVRQVALAREAEEQGKRATEAVDRAKERVAAELAQAKAEITALSESEARLKQEVAAAQSTAEANKREMARLEGRVAAAERAHGDTDTRLVEAEDSLTQAQMQLSEYKAEAEASHRELNEARNSCQRLQTQLQHRQQELAETTAAASKLELALTDAKSKLADVTSAHEALQREHAHVTAELKDKRAALATAQSSASSGAAAAESLTERVSELERELEHVRQSERRARTRLRAEESAVADVRSELEAEVAVSSGLREQLKAVEVDRDALQRGHTRSQSEAAALQQQLRKAQEEAHTLSQQLAAAQRRVKALSAEREDASASGKSAVAELQAAQDALAKRDAELTSVKRQLEQASAQAAQRARAAAQSEEQARVHSESAKLAAARVQELQTSLEEARAVADEAQVRCDELSGELAAVKTEAARLHRDKDAAESTSRMRDLELKRAQEQEKQQAAAATQLRAQLREAESARAAAQRRASRAEADAAAGVEALETARAELAAERERGVAAAREAAAATAAADEASRAMTLARADAQRLEDEARGREAALAEARREADRLRGEAAASAAAADEQVAALHVAAARAESMARRARSGEDTADALGAEIAQLRGDAAATTQQLREVEAEARAHAAAAATAREQASASAAEVARLSNELEREGKARVDLRRRLEALTQDLDSAQAELALAKAGAGTPSTAGGGGASDRGPLSAASAGLGSPHGSAFGREGEGENPGDNVAARGSGSDPRVVAAQASEAEARTEARRWEQRASAAEASLAGLRQRLDDLSAEHAEAVTARGDAEAAARRVRKELAGARRAVEAATRGREAAEAVAAQARSELSAAVDKAAVATAAVTSAREDSKRAHRRRHMAMEEVEQQGDVIASLRARLREANASSREALAAQRAHAREADAQRARADAAVAAEVAAAERSTALTQQLAEARQAATLMETRALQSAEEAAGAVASRDRARARVAALERDVEALEAAVADAQAGGEGSATALAAAARGKQELESQLKRKTAELQVALQDVEAYKSSAERLEAALEEADKDRASVRRQLRQLALSLEQAQEQLAAASSQRAEQEAAAEAAAQQLAAEAATVAKLRGEVAQLRSVVKRRDAATGREASLRTALESGQVSLRQQLEEEQDRCAALRDEVAQVRRELLRLRSRAGDADASALVPIQQTGDGSGDNAMATHVPTGPLDDAVEASVAAEQSAASLHAGLSAALGKMALAVTRGGGGDDGELAAVQEELEEQHARAGRLLSAHRQLRAQVDDGAAVASRLRLENHMLVKAATNAHDTADGHAGRVRSLTLELTQAREALRDAQAAVSEHRQTARDAMRAAEEATSRADDADARLAAVQGQLARERGAGKEARGEASARAAEASALQDRIVQLEREAASATADAARRDAAASHSSSVLAAAQRELAARAADATERGVALERAQAALRKSRAEAAALREQVALLRGEARRTRVASASSDGTATPDPARRAVEAAQAAAQSAVAAERATVKEVSATLEAVTRERDELLRELEAAGDAAVQVARLRQSVASTAAERDDAVSNVAMLQGIVKGLKEELSAESAVVRQLREALAKHRRSASYALAEAGALATEKAALAAATERSRISADKLSVQLSEAKKGLSRATKARLAAQQQLRDAQEEAKVARLDAEQAAAIALDIMQDASTKPAPSPESSPDKELVTIHERVLKAQGAASLRRTAGSGTSHASTHRLPSPRHSFPSSTPGDAAGTSTVASTASGRPGTSSSGVEEQPSIVRVSSSSSGDGRDPSTARGPPSPASRRRSRPLGTSARRGTRRVDIRLSSDDSDSSSSDEMNGGTPHSRRRVSGTQPRVDVGRRIHGSRGAGSTPSGSGAYSSGGAAARAFTRVRRGRAGAERSRHDGIGSGGASPRWSAERGGSPRNAAATATAIAPTATRDAPPPAAVHEDGGDGGSNASGRGSDVFGMRVELASPLAAQSPRWGTDDGPISGDHGNAPLSAAELATDRERSRSRDVHYRGSQGAAHVSDGPTSASPTHHASPGPSPPPRVTVPPSREWWGGSDAGNGNGGATPRSHQSPMHSDARLQRESPVHSPSPRFASHRSASTTHVSGLAREARLSASWGPRGRVHESAVDAYTSVDSGTTPSPGPTTRDDTNPRPRSTSPRNGDGMGYRGHVRAVSAVRAPFERDASSNGTASPHTRPQHQHQQGQAAHSNSSSSSVHSQRQRGRISTALHRRIQQAREARRQHAATAEALGRSRGVSSGSDSR